MQTIAFIINQIKGNINNICAKIIGILFAAALNFVHVFLILTRLFSQQKSRLKYFDIIVLNTYHFYYSDYGLKKQAIIVEDTALSSIRKYVHTFFTRNAFFNSALVFLRCYLIHINIITPRDLF